MIKPIKNLLSCFLVGSLLSLISCATPSEQFSNVARALSFSGFSLNTNRFDHQIYLNEQALQYTDTEVLHVYIDGDGTPWEQQRWITDDPTSRNPIILELMHQDKKPALFLGRPCYHGFSHSGTCDNRYWTSHRYSDDVVNSMVKALQLWLQKRPYRHIVLIGFSGGGTLAVLMASDIAEVQTAVTLAANLDTEAWSTYHHFLPLTNSLNPASRTFNARFKQIHLAGLKDTNVPLHLIKAFADKQANAKVITYPNFDHHCCWVKEWSTILSLF